MRLFLLLKPRLAIRSRATTLHTRTPHKTQALAKAFARKSKHTPVPNAARSAHPSLPSAQGVAAMGKRKVVKEEEAFDSDAEYSEEEAPK